LPKLDLSAEKLLPAQQRIAPNKKCAKRIIPVTLACIPRLYFETRMHPITHDQAVADTKSHFYRRRDAVPVQDWLIIRIACRRCCD
jgi:hypothetical protein